MDTLLTNLAALSLTEIAILVRRDWKNVYFGAVPYLEALGTLNSIKDNYICDSGSSIVAYFLANSQTWRGETAKAVKKELNARLKASYKLLSGVLLAAMGLVRFT